MTMILDDWVSEGWLQKHQPIGKEIRKLLELAESNLKEALKRSENPDWSFNIAYASIINLAEACLKAQGFRTRAKARHYYAIESLEYTVNLDPDLVRSIDSYRELRHKVTYVETGLISHSLAEEIIGVASELMVKIVKHLKENYSQFLNDK